MWSSIRAFVVVVFLVVLNMFRVLYAYANTMMMMMEIMMEED